MTRQTGLETTERRGLDSRLTFWWNMLVRIGLIAFAGFFLWRTREIIVTIMVSLILASVANALVVPLCRRRIPGIKPHTQRFLATALVFVFLIGAVATSVYFLIKPFQLEYAKLQKNWPTYKVKVNETANRARDLYGALPQDIRDYIDTQRANTPETLPSPGEIAIRVLRTTFLWASHAFELLLIPILAFYFVMDSRRLRNELLFLVPPLRLRSTLAVLREATRIMRAYIVAQFWLAVIAGIVVACMIPVLHMDYALILGLFAGITRAIPVVGGFLGTIPILIMAVIYGAQHGQPYLWLQAFAILSIFNVLETKWLMPKLLGHHLDLHPVLIIVALLIGGEFFGLMGMFLAAPVAAFARVLIVNYYVRSRRATVSAASDDSENGKLVRLDRALRFKRGNYQ